MQATYLYYNAKWPTISTKKLAVADIGLALCAATALIIEEEGEKKKKRSQRTIASKQKVNEWWKKREKLDYNITLLHELEEKDIASFKPYSPNTSRIGRIARRSIRIELVKSEMRYAPYESQGWSVFRQHRTLP